MSRKIRQGMIAATGLAMLVAIAGCSTAGAPESTAAIAPAPADPAAVQPAAGTAEATTAANGAAPTQPVAQGTAVAVADASCEALKAELATATADKIPQKLADFGKAKYVPTAEESARFARYVEVSKASKAKCGTSAATVTKKAKQAAKVTKKKVTTEPTVEQVPAASEGAVDTAPADGGITTTMDSSG